MTISKRYLLDITERVAWTFVQAFAAVWLIPVIAEILSGGTLASVWSHVADTSVLDKAAIAGLAGVLSMAKGLLARTIGDHRSAATLPAPPGYDLTTWERRDQG